MPAGGECDIRLIPGGDPTTTLEGVTSNPLQSLFVHAPAKSVSEVVRGFRLVRAEGPIGPRGNRRGSAAEEWIHLPGSGRVHRAP